MSANDFDVQPVVIDHWLQPVIGGVHLRDVELGVAQVADARREAKALHGDLSAGRRAAPGSAQTPVLILNGADDKFVTAEDIAALQREMNAAGADWQFVDFSGAVHCFALPQYAGNDAASNCRYDPRAARRAYRMMDDFFGEAFGPRTTN